MSMSFGDKTRAHQRSLVAIVDRELARTAPSLATTGTKR
jgi:hypothetical protein